jgi:hypothetical protein
MSKTENQDMDWFYKHLFAYRRGVLDEMNAARFERMLNESQQCRDALSAAEVLERTEEDTAHLIPTAVLARWKEIAPKLDEEERELVLRHLERCEETRQDIELLGLSGAVEDLKRCVTAEDSLESSRGAIVREDGAARPRSEREGAGWKFGGSRIFGDRRWLAWGMGLYGAAATVVVVFLLVRQPGLELNLKPSGLSAPIHILQTTRGVEPESIAIACDAAYLVLSPSGQNLSGEYRELTVRLFDPGDKVLYEGEAHLSVGDEQRRIVVVVPNPEVWTAGSYRLTVEVPATGQVLSEYAFSLDVR